MDPPEGWSCLFFFAKVQVILLFWDHDDVTDDDDYKGDHIPTYLHGERVYEMTSLAQVQAVQTNEPIRGRDHFGQERHLKM